ncbi:MAG TPA: (Fe-S)-binding protein [Nitrospirota bacterium]|nr:(Fe-S)-binding protein [Nitrospirota bacterium]
MNRLPPSTASRSSRLERYRDKIARCVRCGTCRAVCPAFLPDRDESLSARGRMALIEAVLEGRLTVSALYQDRLETCTGCLACEATCPSGVPVTEIVQAAKEEAVRLEGRGLIHRMVSASLADERLMRGLAWVAPIVLRYAGKSVTGRGILMRNAECGLRNGKTGAWGGSERCRMQDAGSRKSQKPQRRIAFFPGCAVAFFQRDIERASVNVLNALGYEVIIPDGLECCGRPHLGLGDRTAAEASAHRNTAVLSSLDVDAVVTACASCGLTFKKEYPTLLAPSGRQPVPVLDIHELLAGKISGTVNTAVQGKVTWHDPCHLGRGQGLSRTARTVLHAIPGLVLREMDAPDRCCGFGGVMRVSHHRLSDRIGEAKAVDIITTGASMVITGCPGCRMQIADSLRRAGSHAVVVHTVQVVEKALGVRGTEPVAAGFSLREGKNE